MLTVRSEIGPYRRLARNLWLRGTAALQGQERRSKPCSSNLEGVRSLGAVLVDASFVLPQQRMSTIWREAILEHLIATEKVSFDGVWLSMGEEGEKRFGRRRFLELVSVFTSSPDFEMLYGRHPIP